MAVDDGEMQRLWKLTNELTSQLVFNGGATLELKQQLAEFQTRAPHGLVPVLGANENTQGISATVILYMRKMLNKFVGNLLHCDICNYVFSCSLTDCRLRIENGRLQEENNQLHEQVREYERWMEYIMTKFRLQNVDSLRTISNRRKEEGREGWIECCYKRQQFSLSLFLLE